MESNSAQTAKTCLERLSTQGVLEIDIRWKKPCTGFWGWGKNGHGQVGVLSQAVQVGVQLGHDQTKMDRRATGVVRRTGEKYETSSMHKAIVGKVCKKVVLMKKMSTGDQELKSAKSS